MCTLVIGRDVMGPQTVWLAANRDEDPGRPADPPGVLLESPRVVGGRDRVAGGTWLAVRGVCAVAMLNRRGAARAAPRAASELRSRGLLALDVARVVADDGGGGDATTVGVQPEPAAGPRLREGVGALSRAALERAQRLVRQSAYAPFSLVFVSPLDAWLLTQDEEGLIRVAEIPAGWHVMTHADLDDRSEPRTARLLDELSGRRPGTEAEAERGLLARLAEHDGAAGGAPMPAVCIHEGRMVTVSSSLVHLTPDRARYLHAEGRPCENPFLDFTPLLAGGRAAPERS
jgi:hypothetical protein